MKINNKLKQGLCGQSYGSNSERKELDLDLDSLEKETTKPLQKKNKGYKLLTLGETLKLSRADILRDDVGKLDLASRWYIGYDFILRTIGELDVTKKGRPTYMGEILDVQNTYSFRRENNIPEGIIGMKVKFKAKHL